MRKKEMIILPLLALMLLGAACHDQTQSSSSDTVKSSKTSSKKKKTSQNKQSSRQSSSKKVSSSEVVESKSSSEENSSKSSVSSSSNSASSSSKIISSSPSSSTSSTKPTTENRLSMITAALKRALPGEKFPQSGISTNPAALNSRYTGNGQNYTVYYYTTGNAVNFNDGSLANRQATATLQKATYSSPTAAQSAINYQAPETGLPTVDLGTDISATKQGAAGSTYLNWTEGRWSLVTRASNVNREDGEPLAKQVVALLHTRMLPVPDVHGAINLYVSSDAASRMNTVSWSKGNAAYTVAAADPMVAVQMATSLQ